MEPKIKLQSKKLPSGRYQIHFSTTGPEGDWYGYLLAEPRTPLQEVVMKISRHVGAAASPDRYFQPNLFSLRSREVRANRIFLFKRKYHEAA
ncbi:MAG: hypothetical protein JNL17_05555 [Cyclobacteriaceae bacterium]|nr:hypothetical protein [Cyclobacteriaceae bacterium]